MRGRQTLSLSWWQWGVVVLVLLAVLPHDVNAQRRRTRFRSRSRNQVQSDEPRGWVNCSCGLRRAPLLCLCSVTSRIKPCSWSCWYPTPCGDKGRGVWRTVIKAVLKSRLRDLSYSVTWWWLKTAEWPHQFSHYRAVTYCSSGNNLNWHRGRMSC